MTTATTPTKDTASKEWYLQLENQVRYSGINPDGTNPEVDHDALRRLIAVKLASSGFDVPANLDPEDAQMMQLATDLFCRYAEQSRLLTGYLTPIDTRVQEFLDDCLKSTGEKVNLPERTLNVDRYGMARELALPEDKNVNEFHNEQISSYRLRNGVLHNPLNDRRTTKGSFHIADYGLPIPADKIAVPLVAFARMMKAAFEPPSDLNMLPYSAKWEKPVETMVSLMIRPLVHPEVPGFHPEKRLEVRYFVPGGCVANIDFVESIFGNSGDPHLPENDAALDTEHWTGTTGCVILAPHLLTLRKKDLGLPHVSEATEDQKATGMCWSNEYELYNSGKPFKITCRDERGIMVTLLADNYFGYCKKETKTQIGLAANIFGLAEEEHAGGALAYKAYNLGQHFYPESRIVSNNHRFAEAISVLGDTVELHPEGYATDKNYPTIHILPEDMQIDLVKQKAYWHHGGGEKSIRILPNHVYVHPSGYKVHLQKHPKAPTYRLIGVGAEGTYCHKPCTVSGGGKSEISKSLNDAVIYGPIYIGDYEKDMDQVEDIINHDYSGCFKPEHAKNQDRSPSRKVLSDDRSLGSVIKLLTPNEERYTEEHNKYVSVIPNHIRAIVFVLKRFYKSEWGDEWRKHFSVDVVNGADGHELKIDGRALVGSYLRIGLSKDSGNWRTYKLRQDFCSADKVQMEDDITASVVVPREQISGLPAGEYDRHPSLKLSQNCEWRLFQRPDDAIHPGYDKQTEWDMSQDGLLSVNFKPIEVEEMKDISERIDLFDLFTDDMKGHLERCVADGKGINVCSAKPRIWEGKPTKNPRYLQLRPDVAQPRDKYLAQLGSRLHRKLPMSEPVNFPVGAVITGKRNNPPDTLNGLKIRPLCVFNPIHYQELPELFMDYICSVTGKSPSTTGAGSEGALTKGPFNAIPACADLNNCYVSMLLTKYGGFCSAAGWIGPNYRMDHDISMIIPELWCRMKPEEKDPELMIEKGELEKVDDFEYEGRTIPASRLGYRITNQFVLTYLGRMFDNPTAVFTEEILKPETQDLDVYADGIENLAEAQKKSALNYFKDGTIADAIPPLRIVLHVMAYGHFNGKSILDPEIRKHFTREAMLESDWYKLRLKTKQDRDIALWTRKIKYLKDFMGRPGYESEVERLGIKAKLEAAEEELARVSDANYIKELGGTLGADPVHGGYSYEEGNEA